ncbi:helix-turn-helix domain-containing protein [Myroides sp. DW712]|uniref:AraC family transcriptional regulator n=1 Tax=Myroides sp. DW712 TaxID=3389800 RepID=UPI00397E6B4C
MKLYDWNANVQIERFFFIFFICFSFLLLVNYYYVMIVHKTAYVVNFFAIIFSIKLVCIMAEVVDEVLKRQLLQLMSISVFILILSFLPVPFWMIVTVNNLFALGYFVFLHLHKKKSEQKYRLIQSYVSLIHSLYIIYLITLNLQVFFLSQQTLFAVVLLSYLHVGLQIVLLTLSMVSYLFYMNLLREQKRPVFFGFTTQKTKVEEEKDPKPRWVRQEDAAVLYQFSYKHQVIVEQLLEFFETSEAYLQSDFSLEVLGKCISNPNLHLISFAINNHLHTTFYKLVAYYRILYALKLLAHRQDWTLIAIAESVGFKSVNTFNKYFKELTGLTPVEYRIILERKRG